MILTVDGDFSRSMSFMDDAPHKLCSFEPFFTNTLLGVELKNVCALVEDIHISLHQAVFRGRYLVDDETA